MDEHLHQTLWNEDLTALLAHTPVDQIWRYVQKTLIDRFDTSGLAVILYAGETLPSIIYSHVCDALGEDRISAYLQGAYLLDPFFRAIKDQDLSGCYSLEDLAPEGYKGGEYYNNFFTVYGLSDELNVIIPLKDKSVVAISIGRDLESAPFAGRARDFLDSGFDFLRALVERTVAEDAQRPKPLDRQMMARFHENLKTALDSIGTSVLSPREKTILDHLLQGYSVKATSERLDIAEGTIRIHRHSIYNKLDVSSQNELFALVIEALKNLDFMSNADPLVSLLPPERAAKQKLADASIIPLALRQRAGEE